MYHYFNMYVYCIPHHTTASYWRALGNLISVYFQIIILNRLLSETVSNQSLSRFNLTEKLNNFRVLYPKNRFYSPFF